jgi:hypothetical protein
MMLLLKQRESALRLVRFVVQGDAEKLESFWE